MIAATREGDFLTVCRLVASGADAGTKDELGMPLFVSAFETGHEDIARYLVAHGAGDIREAYEHRRLERARALERTGLEAHVVHMRVRSQQCVLCGKPVNYLRFLVDEKHYCVEHETDDAETMHALDTLSAFW